MKIDRDLITYLEELARLRLSEREQNAMAESLGDILGYVEALSRLDTAGVEELSHPFAAANAFREDTVSASFDRTQILDSAPQQKQGCFWVPKTVE